MDKVAADEDMGVGVAVMEDEPLKRESKKHRDQYEEKGLPGIFVFIHERA